MRLQFAQSLPRLPGRQVVDGLRVREHRDGGRVSTGVRQGGGRELDQDGVDAVCLTVCKLQQGIIFYISVQKFLSVEKCQILALNVLVLRAVDCSLTRLM